MIPESQLSTWSNQGATQASQDTHESIRLALSQFKWSGITYKPYLQGSYRNSTNIRGNSDVDLVVELTSSSYSNLTIAEKSALGISHTDYGLDHFYRDVVKALSNYYGADYIDTTGNKSIKIKPNSGRLKADVVICATYKHYKDMRLIANGITFWTWLTREQIINFPTLHYDNGAAKNTDATNGWFKPAVRVFKNARERIKQEKPLLAGKFPSYFVECLFYNVPKGKYGSSYQSTFTECVNWLNNEFNAGNEQRFVCQNEMSYLFGTATTQWNTIEAREYITQLINLWNNW